ncbi:dienelactone hydrolase family protein, partial [Dickeya dianthicola]
MKTDALLTLRETTRAFSPAVMPLASSAMTTDAAGLVAGETTIPSQGDSLPAYIAKPEKTDGPLPIVLVVQEIFGVHEHIRDVCRRLAKQGYLAIAPELYFRQGDPQQYSDIPTLMRELVSKVPDNQILSDLDHTAHWAVRQGGDASRLA